MLSERIQSKIGAAMTTKLSGATQALTLKRITKQVDKVRGEAVESVSTYQARGLCRLSWSAQDIAALNIPQTDGKAIILQNELPVQPLADDVIDFGDGECRVIHVLQDPVQAVWIIRYRKA